MQSVDQISSKYIKHHQALTSMRALSWQQNGRYPRTVVARQQSRIQNWNRLHRQVVDELHRYRMRVDQCRQEFDKCDAKRNAHEEGWQDNIPSAFQFYRIHVRAIRESCIKMLNQLIWNNLRFYVHDSRDNIEQYRQRCEIIDGEDGLKSEFYEYWNLNQDLYTRLAEWDRQGWITNERHRPLPPPEPIWEPQPGNTHTGLYHNI